MAGTELLRIANLNTMEVRVNVNENDIIRVNVGDSAIVEVDSYSGRNEKFLGIVTQIANTAKDAATLEAVKKLKDKNWQLYDMEKDRSEKYDVAAKNPALVKTLNAKWYAWANTHQVLPKGNQVDPYKK